MPQERSDEFAYLLREAFQAIKKCEDKNIRLIQDEIGYALGREGGSAVERWRKGYLPPDIPTLEKLARLIKERSCRELPDSWFYTYFQVAAHPAPQQAIEELLRGSPVPQVGPFRIPPPPRPRPLPRAVDFVGRQAEIAVLSEQLAQTGCAFITGMAGIGKTTLAIRLAQQTGESEHIFWYSLVEGEGVALFIRALAAFLAYHNEPSLWETLEQARLAASRPPEIGLQFAYLTELLRKKSFLICLDDYQSLDDDPHLDGFLTWVVNEQNARKPRLLITSRGIPSFAPTSSVAKLEGLTITDVRKLMAQRNLVLADHHISALHENTEGNAQFLILAIDALKQTREPAQLIERLAESANIEHFLMRKVNERLNAQEQIVMEVVSLLLGYAGTRDAIEFIVNQVHLQLTLTDLARRHLLTQSPGVYGRVYGQHAIVQAFYYEQMNRRQKRQLHERAAAFYEREEPDRLRAGMHYQRAGNWVEAAELLTLDIWGLVNQGQAGTLLRLLESSADDCLQPSLWSSIKLAQGDLFAFTGQHDLAEAAYQSVIALPSLDDLPSQHMAHACRGLSELREYNDPADALVWASRGLQALEIQDVPTERAALLISKGVAQMNLQNLEAAEDALKEGLSIQIGANALSCSAQRNLGAVCYYRGQRESAITHTKEALALSRQLRDPFQTAGILSNLGVYEFEAGEWQQAITHWQEAYNTARQLGNQLVAVSAGGNLGGAYTDLGNYELAQNHLQEALAGSQAAEMTLFEIVLKYRLGYLFMWWGDYDKALAWLQLAETQALQAESEWDLPDIYRVQAETRFAQGNEREALVLAQRAVEMSSHLEDPVMLGKGLRVLGNIQHGLGDDHQALNSFATSENLLRDRDIYETARTQLAWAKLLISLGKAEQGQVLLQSAKQTFQRLGIRASI